MRTVELDDELASLLEQEKPLPYFLMTKEDWEAEKASIDAWLRSWPTPAS